MLLMKGIGLGGIEPPLYNPKLYALPITPQSELKFKRDVDKV